MQRFKFRLSCSIGNRMEYANLVKVIDLAFIPTVGMCLNFAHAKTKDPVEYKILDIIYYQNCFDDEPEVAGEVFFCNVECEHGITEETQDIIYAVLDKISHEGWRYETGAVGFDEIMREAIKNPPKPQTKEEIIASIRRHCLKSRT